MNPLIFANIAGWIWAHKKIVALTLVVFFVVIFGWYLWRGWNRSIKREQNAIATENQIRVDEAKTNANIAANESNAAKENVKKTENADFKNTNLQDAEKLRCQAFPDSKGCKK